MFKNLKFENFTYSQISRFYLENQNKKCRKSKKHPKMNSKIQKFVRVSGPKKMPKNLKLTRKSQEFIWKSMKKMLKNPKIVTFTDSLVPRFYLGNLNKNVEKFLKPKNKFQNPVSGSISSLGGRMWSIWCDLNYHVLGLVGRVWTALHSSPFGATLNSD